MVILSKSAKTAEVVDFLREFKPLECACCDKLVGFRHRMTGGIFCLEESHDDVVKMNGHALAAFKAHAAAPLPLEPKKEGDEEKKPKPRPAPLTLKAEEPTNRAPSAPAPAAAPRREREREEAVRAPAPAAAPRAPAAAAAPRREEPVSVRAPAAAPSHARDEVDYKNAKNRAEVMMPVKEKEVHVPAKPSIRDTPPLKVAPAGAQAANPFFNTGPINPVVKATATAKEVQQLPQPPAMTKAPAKRWMWKDCKYSKNLNGSQPLSVSFQWNIHLYQMFNPVDSPAMEEFQLRIATYVQEQAKPLTRPPHVGEMVIADYGGTGDYYRGRVIDVDGERCAVTFVDYGDQVKGVKFKRLYEITEELVKVPIYSMMVILDGIPPVDRKLKNGKRMADILAGELQVTMTDPISVDNLEPLRAMIDFGGDKTLNEVVSEVLAVMADKA